MTARAAQIGKELFPIWSSFVVWSDHGRLPELFGFMFSWLQPVLTSQKLQIIEKESLHRRRSGDRRALCNLLGQQGPVVRD